MKKGKGGNSKGSHYWRNKILKERKKLPAKFKGRLRSKGYKPNYPKSFNRAKGQKWQNKIRAERGLKPLKSNGFGKTSSIMKKRKANKLKSKTLIKPQKKTSIKPVRKSNFQKNKAPIGNPLVNNQRISQPVSNKRNLNQLKKRQSRVVKPKITVPKIPSKGISMLKGASGKNQPPKSPVKVKSNPSKGIQMLKKSVGKSQLGPNKVKPVKKKQ